MVMEQAVRLKVVLMIPLVTLILKHSRWWSCIYEFTTYYLDTDGDGLGYGAGQEFCENPGEGWSLNGDDLYPNCSSNMLILVVNVMEMVVNVLVAQTPKPNETALAEIYINSYRRLYWYSGYWWWSCIYVPGEFTFEQSTNRHTILSLNHKSMVIIS